MAGPRSSVLISCVAEQGPRTGIAARTVCPACGRWVHSSEDCCNQCGTSLAGPATGTGDPRGLAIEVKTGFRSRSTGIIMRASGTTLEVLTPAGELQELPWSKAGSLTSDATTAAVRFWRLRERPEVVTGRLSEFLDRELLPDVAQSRALALHGVTVGEPEAVSRAQLSESERLWLIGHLAWQLGQREAAADHFLALPADGYPDVGPILACLWPEISGDPGLRIRALERARSSPSSPWSDALVLVLDASEGTEVPADVIVAVCEQLAKPPDDIGTKAAQTGRERLALVADAFRSTNGQASEMLGGVFALRSALKTGRPLTEAIDPKTVSHLSLEVIDDLIDGRVQLPIEAMRDARFADHEYLVARTDPTAVPDEQLEAFGLEREKVRRAALDGDRGAHDGVTGDDPELHALARLAAGDTSVVAELAMVYRERGDEHRLDVVTALGRSLTSGVIDDACALDRSCWPLLQPLLPDPSRWTDRDSSSRAIEAWSVLHESLQQLWSGAWEEAAARARNVLRVAPTERSRDEALNVLAYANWILGRDEAAASALRDAVDGEHNANLQVNYSLVMGSSIDAEDKYAASIQLAALADESSDLERGVQAVLRAVALWNEIPAGTEIGDVPPPELVSAARRLAVLPTSEPAHDSVMGFLAWADGDWLGKPENTVGSRWAQTVRHRYRVARADGPEETVAILQEATNETADAADRAWAHEQAQSTAETLIHLMVADVDEPPLGCAMWGLELCDAGVIELDCVAIRLELVGAVTAAKAVTQKGDGLPADMIWDHVEHALARYETSSEAQDELSRDVIQGCVASYASFCMPAWARVYGVIVDAFNPIASRLSGINPRQINRSVVREATDPLLAMISSLDTDIYRVRMRVEDVELHEPLDELRRGLAELHQAIMSLPR